MSAQLRCDECGQVFDYAFGLEPDMVGWVLCAPCWQRSVDEQECGDPSADDFESSPQARHSSGREA